MFLRKLVLVTLTLILAIQLSLPQGISQVIASDPGVVGVTLDKTGGFFLLFRGKDVDKEIATQDMKFFLTGIAFPIEEIMVDLNIYNLPENVVSPSLMGTELARVFLEADMRLKELVKTALSSDEVMDAIESVSDGGSDVGIPAFRVWIQPKSVTIVEAKDRAGARIKELTLGVKVEFAQNSPTMMSIFKTYVLPGVEEEINNSKEFSALRRAISAVILADWYKKRSSIKGELASLANTRYSKVGKSSEFWVVRQYLDRYIASYYGSMDGDFITGGVRALPESVRYGTSEGVVGEGPKATLLAIERRYEAVKNFLAAKEPEISFTLDEEELSRSLSEKRYKRFVFEGLKAYQDDFYKLFGLLLRNAQRQKLRTGGFNLTSSDSLNKIVELIKRVDPKDPEINRDFGSFANFVGAVMGILFANVLDDINSTKKDRDMKIEVLLRIWEDVFKKVGFSVYSDSDVIYGMLDAYYNDREGNKTFVSKRKALVTLFKEAVFKSESMSPRNPFSQIAYDGKKFMLGWARPGMPERIKNWMQPIVEKLDGKKNVIVVGMGGSINSVKLMKEAYKLDNVLPLDVPDKALIKGILKEKGVDLKDTAVILISKSGTTYETHAIARILKDIARKEDKGKGNEIVKKNFIWLVDPGNEKNIIDEDVDKGITVVSLQPDRKTDIGGRYSSPWTGVYLIMEYLRFAAGKRDREEALSAFSDRVSTISKNWGKIVFDPDNRINKTAYKEAVILTNMLWMKRFGPRVVIVIPKELGDKLSPEAVEAFRIWLTQLWQESIGGKAPDKGIIPKIDVIVESKVSKEREDLLRKYGFRFIRLPSNELYENMGFMYMLVTYFSAFNQIKFLGQNNVQLYKKELKKIKEANPPRKRSLETLVDEIKEINKPFDFIDVVLYGPYTKKQKAVLRDLLEKLFPDKLVFIYDGPDYNHHSFEALVKDKYTLPVLLVHPQASKDVGKVAKATEMALEDHISVTGFIPDEKIKDRYDAISRVIELWVLREFTPSSPKLFLFDLCSHIVANIEGDNPEKIEELREVVWSVMYALVGKGKKNDRAHRTEYFSTNGLDIYIPREKDLKDTYHVEKCSDYSVYPILRRLIELDTGKHIDINRLLNEMLAEVNVEARRKEELQNLILESVKGIPEISLEYAIQLIIMHIMVKENVITTDSTMYAAAVDFLTAKQIAKRNGKAALVHFYWYPPGSKSPAILMNSSLKVSPHTTKVILDPRVYKELVHGEVVELDLPPLGFSHNDREKVDKLIEKDMVEKRGELTGEPASDSDAQTKKPGGIWIGMDVDSLIALK